MKRTILTLILLIIINTDSFSQIADGYIIYGATSTGALTSNENASPEMKMINNILIEKKNIEFKLLFNKKESYYSIIKALDINDFKIRIAQTLFGGDDVHYFNKETKEMFTYKEAYGEHFIISNNEFKWTILKETKKIDKFICYKAITQKIIENQKGKFIKNVTAWYTNEIPLSYGPRGYGGLPGLILELNEGKLLFYAKEIDLNSKEKVKIIKPIGGKKLSQKEFEDLGKKIGTHN